MRRQRAAGAGKKGAGWLTSGARLLVARSGGAFCRGVSERQRRLRALVPSDARLS
jgi:hypothetical protein